MGRISNKYWIAVAAALAVGAILLPAPRDLILYNHSPSMPLGFYWRVSANALGQVAKGEIVTVRAMDVSPQIAAARHFDGPKSRFIKHVVARAGDRVCAAGGKLAINSAPPIERRAEMLPHWSGCRVLRKDEILLLGETSDSFDGRYWGPISTGLIEGVWRRL